MEVISSIIYHYLSIISNLGFHHSLKYYHFQSYVYMRVYTFTYLNYKFPGFSHSPLLEEISSSKFRIATYICEYYLVLLSPFFVLSITWIQESRLGFYIEVQAIKFNNLLAQLLCLSRGTISPYFPTVEACHAPTSHTFSFIHHFISHRYIVFI